MNRHAIRAALSGRTAATSASSSSSSSSRTARALRLPICTTTPASFFSTSSSGPSDNGSSSSSSSGPRRQNAAVEKLTQLNKRRNNNAPQEGGPRREALDSVPGIPSFGGGGGIDARSLRVSPGGSSSSSSSSSAPRVLNLRSLRGGSGLRGRTPFGRGGGAEGGGGFGRSRFGFGAAGAGGAGPRTGFAGRFGGAGGGFGARTGGPGGRFGSAGRSRGRGRGRGRGRSAADRDAARGRGDGEGKGGRHGGKLVWSAQEQAVLDRLEKGEVVPFDPKLTFDSLAGYGAAVATDAPIGQVETALRTMRLMTGGMAFNADSGVTADVRVVMQRYNQKKPIFVHSKAEKAWIESSQPRLRLVGPDSKTKKAIVDTTILGKYETTGFAETSDVKATMANYHARTFTYMASDSQKFIDKVMSLLPGQGGGQPPAQARR